jgi:quinol monooxygenase YgiN
MEGITVNYQLAETMITLISKWKLRNGMPPELAEALRDVATIVQAQEPGTLVYSVHLSAASPLCADRNPLHPPPTGVPPELQTEVIFFEVYADADAFAAHVNGPIFTSFRTANIQYFYEDPANPGWPNTDTPFLERLAAFFRPEANQVNQLKV